jgi:hypothetical protein
LTTHHSEGDMRFTPATAEVKKTRGARQQLHGATADE